MGSIVPFVADALVLLGLAVLTLGVYGIIRMEGIYLKLQATSKVVLLGLLPILVAASLSGDPEIISRSILIGVLLILTTPISTHAITKAASVREAPDSTGEGS